MLSSSSWRPFNFLRDTSSLRDSMKDVFSKNWYLGFTAFGGPPVHFQIFHKKFVEKHKWIDEQLYQEIFALSQAFPGPASTKMLFSINYVHGGFAAGVGAFALWCLPGAIGMYGLSLGVSRIGDTLPGPVYALLSGLNAATVGIIALAAVQLAEKAITDRLTRALVFLGGVAGMLYTALWYFPVLLLSAGLATVVADFRWLNPLYNWASPLWNWRRRRGSRNEVETGDRAGETHAQVSVPDTNTREVTAAPLGQEDDVERSLRNRRSTAADEPGFELSEPGNPPNNHQNGMSSPTSNSESSERVVPQDVHLKLVTWKTGLLIIAAFLISFIIIMTLRSTLKAPPRGLSLFANLYLAGTIIFGGGPVVIPLLREYIVAEGWVSPRDFLLGVALVQSFPGPNFNIAVYLGSLAALRSPLPSYGGALIGLFGIFTPGIVIAIGVIGLWKIFRSHRWLISLLRGVNAGAVGLVFTAVYKLWQVGLVDAENQTGSPLGRDPWWVAITATSFVGGAWFGLSAPLAILLGGIMGLVWYGVVSA